MIGDKTPIDKGHLLSSVVWNLEPVYTAMVEDLKADKFGTHPYSIQLADDSVHLLRTSHIPDDVWAAISEVRQQIVEGKLKVEPIWEADKVRALMSSITDSGAQ